jgi:hypothetical protein
LPLFDPLPRKARRVASIESSDEGTRGTGNGWVRPGMEMRGNPLATGRARAFQRLGALGRALDDLPREARRFARWRARAADAARNAAVAQKGNGRAAGRFRRVWPLRPGRPPGGRLARYDPDAWGGRKNIRDVDEILAHTHALASYALSPDTS